MLFIRKFAESWAVWAVETASYILHHLVAVSLLERTSPGNMYSLWTTREDARQPTVPTRSFPGQYRRFHDSSLENFTSKQHSQSTFRSWWFWYHLYQIFIMFHDACKSCMVVFRYSPSQRTTPTNLTRGYWNTSFCCNPCIPKRVGPNQEPCRAKRLQQQGGLELRDLGVKSSVSRSASISWRSKVEIGREWLNHGKYIVCACV